MAPTYIRMIWCVVVMCIYALESVHLETPPVVTKEYCQSQYFNASCSTDEVLVMHSAAYGRMRTGSCLTGMGGSLGCQTDVLWYMDRKCSGKRACAVYVAEPELHETRPCPRDYASYLEASYQCVGVASGSDDDCSTSSQILITDPQGYIASSVTTTSSWKVITCPWVIMAQRGQRISVSLLSFAGTQEVNSACYELATIREGEHTRSVTTCDATERDNEIYVSRGETLDITTREPATQHLTFPFLIRYEAIGCPDMKIDKDMSLHKGADHVTVKCNFTDQSWTLTCRGTEWMGDVGRCSKDNYLGQQGDVENEEAFPYSILILVAIGVALGVFLGGLLLSMAIVYMKRHQRTHNHAQQASSPHHFSEVPIDPNAKYIDEDEATTLNRNPKAHYLVARQGTGGENTTVVTVPEVNVSVDASGKTVVPCAAYQCRNNIPGGFRLTHLYESPQCG